MRIDESNGIRSLQHVLVNDFNLDLSDCTLVSATGISYDGTVFVGRGINPNGVTEGWIASLDTPEPLPVPNAIILLGSGWVGLAGIRRKLK